VGQAAGPPNSQTARSLGLLAALVLLVPGAPTQETTFRTSVPLVVAPVTVTDAAGKPVDGLSGRDFTLLVDGKPRPFDDDGAIPPVALVVAVQTGDGSAPALAKVARIGPMIQPLITGRRGRAALVAFDREVRTLHDFTNDPYSIVPAFARLGERGGGSRLYDAIDRAVRLLETRPRDHRRILLLFGETRDGGSESKLEHVLTRAQMHNVAVYSVTWSAFLTAMAAKPGEAPPSSGLNLIALFSKIRRQAQRNAAEVFSEYTGGRRFSFVKYDTLEAAVSAIGEEIHSQYLLSFHPPSGEAQGFHRIEVVAPARPDVRIRTRPGYWIEAE
jgi:VWFA-related protein